MGLGGKVLRIGALSVLIVAVSFAGWIRWETRDRGEATFCTLGLAITDIDGESVAIQDGGKPGDDGCGTEETLRDMKVLGMDCKLRAPDGEVVAEYVPNRSDGLCGLAGPSETIPHPWPRL